MLEGSCKHDQLLDNLLSLLDINCWSTTCLLDDLFKGHLVVWSKMLQDGQPNKLSLTLNECGCDVNEETM